MTFKDYHCVFLLSKRGGIMMEFRSYGDAYNFLLEKFQERGFLTDVNLTDSNDFVSVGDMSTLRNALGEI